MASVPAELRVCVNSFPKSKVKYYSIRVEIGKNVTHIIFNSLPISSVLASQLANRIISVDLTNDYAVKTGRWTIYTEEKLVIFNLEFFGISRPAVRLSIPKALAMNILHILARGEDRVITNNYMCPVTDLY